MKNILTKFLVGCLIAGSAVSVSSCGNINRSIAQTTGYSRTCINTISYLQFPSGATVEIDPQTDKPKHC